MTHLSKPHPIIMTHLSKSHPIIMTHFSKPHPIIMTHLSRHLRVLKVLSYRHGKRHPNSHLNVIFFSECHFPKKCYVVVYATIPRLSAMICYYLDLTTVAYNGMKVTDCKCVHIKQCREITNRV